MTQHDSVSDRGLAPGGTVRKTVYLDMDNTLVDFQSAFPKIDPEVLAAYDGHEDDIPGIFALMDPWEGAIEAVHELASQFDVYVLSTAPWDNPSAWQDKVTWIRDRFGAGPESPLYKRVILSHHKNLNLGAFLVDDKPHKRGADRFHEHGGEVIHFGPGGTHETWPEVVAYLKTRA